jgi:hypothetical protein
LHEGLLPTLTRRCAAALSLLTKGEGTEPTLVILHAPPYRHPERRRSRSRRISSSGTKRTRFLDKLRMTVGKGS